MTSLPRRPPGAKKLGLVIDLDICVGCQACAVACKEWNTGGQAGPLTDYDPYGAKPDGVWFNRVHSYEVGDGANGESLDLVAMASGGPKGRTVHFPRSCLQCDDAPCVTVCPTGASYKRAEDGIVLVNPDICIGCKLCSWACPYGAREFNEDEGVMQKCTLCVDRIYNETIPEAERQPACVSACPVHARVFGDLGDPQSEASQLVRSRGGFDLMPEMGTRPVNKYLPPRESRCAASPLLEPKETGGNVGERLLSWLDRALGS